MLAILLSVILTAIYRVVPPPLTPLMVIRLVEGDGLSKTWRAYDEISPHVFKAVIAAEDQFFPFHSGFDLKSIREAIRYNEKQSRRKRPRIRGASTLTQQTAKNLFLWSGRGYVRKGLEAYFTLLIELTWPKERILEVYLNVAQFGDGIYGMEAAARRFYRKPAARLSPEEAATLAAVVDATGLGMLGPSFLTLLGRPSP